MLVRQTPHQMKRRAPALMWYRCRRWVVVVHGATLLSETFLEADCWYSDGVRALHNCQDLLAIQSLFGGFLIDLSVRVPAHSATS